MRFVVIAAMIVIPLLLLGSLGWSLAAGVAERPIGPDLAASQLSAGDVARGAALYQSKCFGCHTPDARLGPSHASPDFKVRYASEETLRAVIRGGRAPMPAFSEQVLSDQDLSDIIAYIRTLK
jgi:ubiquinol-cytochrome c reductase cytochrome c subunit